MLRLIAWFGGFLHWETPLILTVRKKAMPPAAQHRPAA
jgi:hypothetical protein